MLQVLILLIALQHAFFLYLEMFAWTTLGRKVFRSVSRDPDFFEKTKALAANQGLYNGFLVAGLVWSLLINDPVWSRNLAVFFLSCVAVAGIYGAISADRKIFFVQGVPAILGLLMCGLLA